MSHVTNEQAERLLARLKTVDPDAYIAPPLKSCLVDRPWRIVFPKFHDRAIPLAPHPDDELVAAAVDALRAEGILPPPAEAPWPQPTAASLEEMRERLAGVWIGNPDEGGDWPEMVSVPIEMAARLKTYADFAAPHYRNAGLLIAEEDAVALGKVLADRNGWEAPTAGEEPKGTEEGEG